MRIPGCSLKKVNLLTVQTRAYSWLVNTNWTHSTNAT